MILYASKVIILCMYNVTHMDLDPHYWIKPKPNAYFWARLKKDEAFSRRFWNNQEGSTINSGLWHPFVTNQWIEPIEALILQVFTLIYECLNGLSLVLSDRNFG